MKLKPRDFAKKKKTSNEYVYSLSLNTVEEGYDESFEANNKINTSSIQDK